LSRAWAANWKNSSAGGGFPPSGLSIFDQRELRAGDDFPKELEQAARHSALLRADGVDKSPPLY
jgi:hypothetical protein